MLRGGWECRLRRRRSRVVGVRGAAGQVVDKAVAVTSGSCVSRLPPGGAVQLARESTAGPGEKVER